MTASQRQSYLNRRLAKQHVDNMVDEIITICH
jgi:hypothetical protein